MVPAAGETDDLFAYAQPNFQYTKVSGRDELLSVVAVTGIHNESIYVQDVVYQNPYAAMHPYHKKVSVCISQEMGACHEARFSTLL